MRFFGPAMACAVAGALSAGSAWAQWGASVGVDSDYRYRGVSLSGSRPSARLTLNYDDADRWYAGASATRASLTTKDSYAQFLGYAGWSTQTVDGRSVEFGVDGSHFTGISGYDFAEIYAGILAERWNVRLYYAPDYYGRGVQVGYVESNVHVPIGRDGRLFAHVGELVPVGGRARAGGARADASVGAGLVLGGWDLHLAAVAATRRGPYPAVDTGRRGALVAGASFSF